MTTICRYIHTSGSRCGSPALRDLDLCYHHHKLAELHRSLAPELDPPILHPIALSDRTQREPLVAEYFGRGPLTLEIPPLEDRESIQLALSLVVTAMAQNRIEPARATAILYGLQVASANARNLNLSPISPVRDTVITADGQHLALDEDPEPAPANSVVQHLLATPQEPEPPAEPVPDEPQPQAAEQPEPAEDDTSDPETPPKTEPAAGCLATLSASEAVQETSTAAGGKMSNSYFTYR